MCATVHPCGRLSLRLVQRLIDCFFTLSATPSVLQIYASLGDSRVKAFVEVLCACICRSGTFARRPTYH